MANYRSLIGGFYSATPMDKTTGPVAIRMNNPGAVNGAAWERQYPGYVGEHETTPGNRSTIFETPEHGVAVWYELMKKYRASGAITVRDIIWKYGGGQANYATTYLDDVTKRTGLQGHTEIKLTGDDATLLKFAKAMFRHEAGRETPLSDAQIMFGFKFARDYAATGKAPTFEPVTTSTPARKPPDPAPSRGVWAFIFALIQGFFAPKKFAPTRILQHGDNGPDVSELQERLRKLGFADVNVDGDFGDLTERAVRTFQMRHNLDPDGEVGNLTVAKINAPNATQIEPELLPPSTKKYGEKPGWYLEAEKDIGWKEIGNNANIDYFIKDTNPRNGKKGDPYCAIAMNAWLARAGIVGSGSAMARSFERNPNFVKLNEPALGAIVTMWRGSPSSGSGHVFTYDGENASGVRGIGANESDTVKRSMHARSRITGYWWPASVPLPLGGRIVVGEGGATTGSET